MILAEADTSEISALVERYRVGFATLDAAKLRSIWDPNYEVIYCPMELKKPLRGRQEIDGYYDQVTKHFRVSKMQIAGLSIDISGDVAFAFFTFSFEGEVAESTEPLEVEGRSTIIFHRVGGDWRGIHYHESRRGPY
jgi:ketosteroid isomerase-like protein